MEKKNMKDKNMKTAKNNGALLRRNFIRRAGAGMGGAALLSALTGRPAKASSGSLTGVRDTTIGDYDMSKHNYVNLVDVTKCIGCGSCVRGCYRENNVPEHYFRTWVERYLVSRTGHVYVDSPHGGLNGFDPVVTGSDITKGFFVPKLCNHCTFTPCVQLCPVGASYRTMDGLVLVDQKRCIGCGYCVQACPYGSRFIHPVTHTASKCTFCYHRITKGLLPACVHSCPTGARMFGDRKQKGDRVTEFIADNRVHVLKPELLTHPNCYYYGLSMEVR